MQKSYLPLSLALVLLVGLLSSRPVDAQTPGTGAVIGSVFDPSGKVVSHAKVAVTEPAGGISRSVTTTSEGLFRVPLLPPGQYEITVTADGFEKSAPLAVDVTVSNTSSVRLVLAVAGVNTTVQVEIGAQTVDLESSTLGGLVDKASIQSLPLSSRNYTQILGLSPGVIADLPTATTLGNGTQNVASNGATPTANNIQFNGIDANNLQENSAAAAQGYEVGTAVPAPDTIEEFRVQTANFDAGYGRGSGANVDLVSRSGTNNLHGSAWEFVRNNIFNANDFFSKEAGQARADLKQNEFGGTIGGPIRRDRLFFFAGYQGITQVNGLGSLKTVVLPQFTSDRSASALSAQFCPTGHLDSHGQPSQGYLTAAGGTQVQCDGSNLNPVAVALLNAKLPNGQLAIPSPQVPLPPAQGTDPSDQLPVGLSAFSPPAHYRDDQATANLDSVLNTKNTLSARFFYSRDTFTLPFAPNGENLPGWDTDQLNRNTMFVLADTHVFNSNLVNIARFGYMRFDGLVNQQNPISAQDVGVGTPTGDSAPDTNMPFIAVAGFVFGDGGTPSDWSVTNSFIYQDTLALTRGKHNMRFGAEVKRHEVDENQPQQVDGNFSAPTIGDFLLGESAAVNQSPLGFSNLSNSGAGAGIYRRDSRFTDFAGFAQDDIKLTPLLTLNAGLRYEIFGAPKEINGRLTNFDPALATLGILPAGGSFLGYTVPANFQGPVPTGVTKTSYDTFYRTPHGDLAPRLGFAWQMTDKPTLVLRGGFGSYFDRHSGNIPEQTLSQAPFAFAQFNFGAQNAGATLQNPFTPALPPGSAFPRFTPLTQNSPSAPFIEATNPSLKDGNTFEYNLNLQYGFGSGYVLQVAYVGTHSAHRSGQYVFDQASLASPTSPVNGETTNSTSNVSNRMPIQGITPGSLLTDDNFEANFNAFEASLTRQLHHGLELQASYTWSKNLDQVNGEGGTDVFELNLPTNNNLDLRNSYGLANDDRSQRLVVSFVWSTPQLPSSSRLTRSMLEHWQLSGIALIQSGSAFSIFDGNAGSVYGLLGGQVRAERAPGGHPSTHGSLFSRVSKGYLDPNAFMRAPEVPFGTSIADEDFGNSGVGFVRGPGQHNLDLAVERIFPVLESKSLMLRAEVFNLTNTPQFGNPNNNLGYGNPLGPAVASSSFGLITSEQGGPHPRVMQLAARFVF